MTYEQIGAAIVAAAVVAWPKIQSMAKAVWKALPGTVPVPVPAPSPEPLGQRPVSYEEAIHNLALVRGRLNVTGLLGDDKSPQRAAIDTLTLALVAGSDK
jgi:hypothetical protein